MNPAIYIDMHRPFVHRLTIQPYPRVKALGYAQHLKFPRFPPTCHGSNRSRPGDLGFGCSVPKPIAAAPAVVSVTVTAPAKTVTAKGTVTAVTTVVPPPETVVETVTETAEPSTTAEVTDSTTPTGLRVGGAGITASNDDGGASIAVLSVQRKTAGTGDYSKPPKNGNYVLIDVSYTCTSGTWNYNPFDWTVRDADGRTYDTSAGYLSGYTDGTLDSGTVAKGAKARGTLVVDAPKGALTLEYSAGFNSAPATWTIPA